MQQIAPSEITNSSVEVTSCDQQRARPDKIKKLSSLPLLDTGNETGSSFEDSEDDEYDLLDEIDDVSAISGNSSSQLSQFASQAF